MTDTTLAGLFIVGFAVLLCIPAAMDHRRKRRDRRQRQVRANAEHHAAVIFLLADGTLQSPTPIFDALADDFCKAAVAGIDDEWREVSGL